MTDIAFFLMDLNGGGAEKVMLSLANGFVDRGLKVDLVLVKLEGDYLSLISPKVRVINLQGHRLLAGLYPLVKLEAELSQNANLCIRRSKYYSHSCKNIGTSAHSVRSHSS
jgi:hypothetical protein